MKTTHDKAHSDRINDIAWADSGLEVYTCSADGFVGRLSLKKSSFSKFRPEGLAKKRQGLFSLALHPSQSSALVGATARVLWVDLDTQSNLASFSGHLQGDVMTLRVFGGLLAPHVMVGGVGDKDRVVSVWKLEAAGGKESNGESSLDVSASGTVRVPSAVFDTNDSVKSAFAVENKKDEDWILGAVTKSGVLHCFHFNPDEAGVRKKKRGKPIRPKTTVQVRESEVAIPETISKYKAEYADLYLLYEYLGIRYYVPLFSKTVSRTSIYTLACTNLLTRRTFIFCRLQVIRMLPRKR